MAPHKHMDALLGGPVAGPGLAPTATVLAISTILWCLPDRVGTVTAVAALGLTGLAVACVGRGVATRAAGIAVAGAAWPVLVAVAAAAARQPSGIRTAVTLGAVAVLIGAAALMRRTRYALVVEVTAAVAAVGAVILAGATGTVFGTVEIPVALVAVVVGVVSAVAAYALRRTGSLHRTGSLPGPDSGPDPGHRPGADGPAVPVTRVAGVPTLVAAVAGVVTGAVALVPALLGAYALPLGWIGAAWTGAPSRARAGLAPADGAVWPGDRAVWPGDGWTLAVAVGVLVGVGLVVLTVAGRRVAAVAVAVTAAVLVPLVAPALDLPWAVALGIVVLSAVTAALAAAGTPARAAADAAPAGDGVADPGTRGTPGLPGVRRMLLAVPAAATWTTALSWSLADRAATAAVLAALLGAATTIAVGGRTVLSRRIGAVAAVVGLPVTAGVTAAAAYVPLGVGAFVVLAAAGLLLAVAAIGRAGDRTGGPAGTDRVGTGRAVGRALVAECTAAAATLYAIAAADLGGLTGTPRLTATGAALIGAGLLAGAHALRSDRRWSAGIAVGCALAASWCWLAASDVGVIEAYTVPAALLVLTAGLLAQRRRPTPGSWVALGPGLAALAGPSLVLLLPASGGTVRALVTGLAGLAVLLAGAAGRRQAPLVLGAAVVLLVGGHEAAPYVVDLATVVPRWIPLAAGGLLLLVLGATYERRRQDLRRLREGYRRLS